MREVRPFLLRRESQDRAGGFFPKRKRPSGALWGIPLQQQLQSALHPATCQFRECVHPPGTVSTSSRRELRLQEPPRGGCPVNGSVCTSSQRELRLQEPGRVQIKEGSASTPIAQRRPTIKKEWVETGNTRIPPGRGNPPTKESPTENNRRR